MFERKKVEFILISSSVIILVLFIIGAILMQKRLNNSYKSLKKAEAELKKMKINEKKCIQKIEITIKKNTYFPKINHSFLEFEKHESLLIKGKHRIFTVGTKAKIHFDFRTKKIFNVIILERR